MSTQSPLPFLMALLNPSHISSSVITSFEYASTQLASSGFICGACPMQCMVQNAAGSVRISDITALKASRYLCWLSVQPQYFSFLSSHQFPFLYAPVLGFRKNKEMLHSLLIWWQYSISLFAVVSLAIVVHSRVSQASFYWPYSCNV